MSFPLSGCGVGRGREGGRGEEHNRPGKYLSFMYFWRDLRLIVKNKKRSFKKTVMFFLAKSIF